MRPKDGFGILEEDGSLGLVKKSFLSGYILVIDHSWARGNKPLAIAGLDYFMMAVAPSLEASILL